MTDKNFLFVHKNQTNREKLNEARMAKMNNEIVNAPMLILHKNRKII